MVRKIVVCMIIRRKTKVKQCLLSVKYLPRRDEIEKEAFANVKEFASFIGSI